MPNARSTEVDSLGVINLIGSNLIDRYTARSILKELLQNADDAGARQVVVGWTPGPGGNPAHQLLRGPALFVVNDGRFTVEDAHAICRFGQNYKFGEKAVIGKFGLGLKSVFHLCEAFFYLSSTPPSQAEDDGLFNNLASPWANTNYHRGWNTVKVEDLNVIRDFLRPICSQLGPSWFALWLPLRRAEHCNGVRFSAREDGDHHKCPPELGGMRIVSEIARALPLLHSVHSVRFWELWGPGKSEPSAQVALETEAARSRFRACVESNANVCGEPATGRYTTVIDRATAVAYALVQSWSSNLLPLTERTDWPRSFVLTGGQQPDKAQPHAAVVLGRHLEGKDGGLDVARAVFLPLEFATHAHPETEFLLTLHGCFFVDSGRRHALHVGEDVRGEWNRRLMSEGVLPLIVPAVESLANTSTSDPEVVSRLTRAIADWMVEEGNRADVCGSQAWVFRWFPADPRWECVESTMTILEIPEFGAEVKLPELAMPGLCGLAEHFVLTPAESPRLTASDPEGWADEVLGRALDVADPQPLFEARGAGLKYLHQFLRQHPHLRTASHTALLKTLRRIFATIRSALLDEQKDVLVQIVGRIPAMFQRSLPLGGNWPEETRRSVCETGSDVLLLPDGFEPKDAKGEKVNSGTATLPSEDAITVLVTLAGAMSPGRNTNPAATVIRAAANPLEVVKAAAELRLWAAQRLSRDKTESVVSTLNELRANHGRRTVFIGPVNDWLRELAPGLAQELTVVPQDTAAALFHSEELPVGNLPGILAVLTETPPLESASARVPLFRRLLTQHPTEELLGSWCWAVRYLLHGISDLSAHDDLYLASGSTGVWTELAQAAVATLNQPGRILPNNELARLLNPEHRSVLKIHALDPSGIAVLLGQIDPHNLRFQFSPAGRDEVIRGLQQYPDLIRGLPLHDRVEGGMTRITKNCYWEGTAEPGTLARNITLLRPCSDTVLAAIQKSAHPLEFTAIELVRLALRIDPAAHAEAILSAFATFRSLAPEQRNKFIEFHDQLKTARWLPLHAGGRVAPAEVLHDDQFGDAIIAALRVVTPAPGDPVPSADLLREVRDHVGFRELARQLFPSREHLVGRLAQVLKRDARFRIGNVDLRKQDERDEWLDAFRDAPVEVMAARNVIGRLDAVDAEVCFGRLLPPLRDGVIPSSRVEKILGFLRDRHDRGIGPKRVLLRIHNDYLRIAAEDRVIFSTVLPRLRLLNEVGEWADPATLCVATGLDRTNTLDFEQQELLEGCVRAQPVLKDLLLDQADAQDTQIRIGDRHFADSVQILREYFEVWRVSEEVAGWAGALLALLGDFEPLQSLANEFLGIAAPGRTAWYIRTKSGMRDAQRLTVRATRKETPSEMMGRQRVLVRLTDPSRPVEVTNLLGATITVNARTEFDTLLIGFGLDRIECPYLKGTEVRCLHLRKINPAGVPRDVLRELVMQTGNLVLRVIFGQEKSQVEFISALEEFSGDDAFGVRVAQESFLNGAQYSLQFLGLNGTRIEHVRELLRLAQSSANRRAEENAMPGKHLPGDPAARLERVFREELQKLVSTDRDVQAELVAAVRRKVREFRYEPRSVLFELFQNADDAYAECNRTPSADSIFVVQETARKLTVFHNGRPINRSQGEADASSHRHDLRKMLSLGHSDKGVGPAAGEVTGRFGLGFKSVFLLTDRPRVVSGRLAFEVLGGVYPWPIEPRLGEELRKQMSAAQLPQATGTMFELQVRNDVNLEEVIAPFRQMAHLLVVFARRIRSIRCGIESTSWDERVIAKTGQTRILVGSFQPFISADRNVQQAVVIRCGEYGDVLFGVNESGFVPISASVPSIWVTAPTTELHEVGYLVNAPLDLDVGRCQVTWDSTANAERLKNLGTAIGDALIALFDTGPNFITGSTQADAAWRSLWQVVAQPGKRQELRDRLMWGETGAAHRFYSARAALPTDLKASEYCNLTCLGAVRTALHGILDARPDVFARVAQWDAFRQEYPPGSVVSQKTVGRHLPRLLSRIDLASAVQSELRQSFVDPRIAERLGHVLTRDSLNAWNDSGDEVVRILDALTIARFRNALNKWVGPAHLVAPAAGEDEAMRGAFAPGDRVLSRDYQRTAVKFFLACRGPMNADAELLAGWVLDADTDDRRNAALRYLERGELGTQVRRLVRKRGISGSWLEDLTPDAMAAAGLDEYEQGVLTAGLGPAPPPPPPPLPPPPAPRLVFARIADWWRAHASVKVRQYNGRVYPDGRLPQIVADCPRNDIAPRIEWLKLFVTGIVQTIGRVTADQNRAFVRLCDTEGWLATLADPVNGAHEWLAAVERYVDRHHGDGIRYLYWLRHFIGVATVSRHLDAYANSFLAINRFDGRFTPRDVMTTRTSRQFQFGGPDAPTIAPILGIGACFVLRELARIQLVTRDDVYPYCFAPVYRLRQFLEGLGWEDDESASVHDRSQSIHKFVAEHHPDDPTFGSAFDIPLLMYIEEHPEVIEIRRSRDSGEWITLPDGRRVKLRD